MYCVYKIENKINHKVYIGSSIRVQQRWKQHLNAAFNIHDNKYHYPLYCAMRKYGVENFDFSIIKNDYTSIEEMQQDEYYWIVFYNSVENGYNQTYNTDSYHIISENYQKHIKKISCPCAKVDKNENIIETYVSYQEAGRKNNTGGSAIRKVCKGLLSSFNGCYFRDLDDNNEVIHRAFNSYHGRKPVIGISISNPDEMIYFESILQASNETKLNRQSIQKCIKGDKKYSNVGGYIWRLLSEDGIVSNEIDINDLIENYNLNNPLINGERHSISEWCKIYNISRQSVFKRIKKEKMDVVTAITTPKRR